LRHCAVSAMSWKKSALERREREREREKMEIPEKRKRARFYLFARTPPLPAAIPLSMRYLSVSPSCARQNPIALSGIDERGPFDRNSHLREFLRDPRNNSELSSETDMQMQDW